jgi:hypothetical protein
MGGVWGARAARWPRATVARGPSHSRGRSRPTYLPPTAPRAITRPRGVPRPLGPLPGAFLEGPGARTSPRTACARRRSGAREWREEGSDCRPEQRSQASARRLVPRRARLPAVSRPPSCACRAPNQPDKPLGGGTECSACHKASVGRGCSRAYSTLLPPGRRARPSGPRPSRTTAGRPTHPPAAWAVVSHCPPRPHPTRLPADLLSKSYSYSNTVELKTSTPNGVKYTAKATVSKPGA